MSYYYTVFGCVNCREVLNPSFLEDVRQIPYIEDNYRGYLNDWSIKNQPDEAGTWIFYGGEVKSTALHVFTRSVEFIAASFPDSYGFCFAQGEDSVINIKYNIESGKLTIEEDIPPLLE